MQSPNLSFFIQPLSVRRLLRQLSPWMTLIYRHFPTKQSIKTRNGASQIQLKEEKSLRFFVDIAYEDASRRNPANVVWSKFIFCRALIYKALVLHLYWKRIMVAERCLWCSGNPGERRELC
ncbi:hypothetical protein I7I51_07616 [Histoplasma capsulatum]|uniref:Uncharacterized protein n=1 Tax=Ajellomyces capsulatus TaxID=5037 RepID=A0A8A1M074_AJECA|nr:hypothetical protein I7I51_07616 [Histoplasma capsulatum]